MMELDQWVNTPRFCKVRINAILKLSDATELGYTEPTHYDNPGWMILGRHIGTNRMVFAAVIKPQPTE